MLAQRIIHTMAGILLLSGLSCIPLVKAETAADFSRANQLLFFTDHLGNIHQPTTLHYRFNKSGSLEKGFTDKIDVQILELHKDGSKKVRVHYFTGERTRSVPDNNSATGNPLLTLFLQRDVREMARLTGGHWRHFQKQIKLALEQTAQVTTVELKIAGKQQPARKIIIFPYRNDPMVKRFQEYREKQYMFTLVDALPGIFYEIRAITPSTTDKPLITESLTYIEAG